jgi:hypothetical protein
MPPRPTVTLGKEPSALSVDVRIGRRLVHNERTEFVCVCAMRISPASPANEAQHKHQRDCAHRGVNNLRHKAYAEIDVILAI